MIIEGETFEDVIIKGVCEYSVNIHQEMDFVVVDKQQARQLIEVLQKWVDGGEVE